MNQNDDLREYASRGRTRGAGSVIEEARLAAIARYDETSNDRHRSALRVLAPVCLATIAIGLVASIAIARDPSPESTNQNVASQEQGVPTTEPFNPLDPTNLSEAELGSATENMTAEQRRDFDLLRDDLVADRVPVESPYHPGVSGFISGKAYLDLEIPQTNADLYPVVDEDGNLIGYWGGQIGMISLSDVQSGFPIDFNELSYERSHVAE